MGQGQCGLQKDKLEKKVDKDEHVGGQKGGYMYSRKASLAAKKRFSRRVSKSKTYRKTKGKKRRVKRTKRRKKRKRRKGRKK